MPFWYPKFCPRDIEMNKGSKNAQFTGRVEQLKVLLRDQLRSLKANWEPSSPDSGATKVEHVSLCVDGQGIFTPLERF